MQSCRSLFQLLTGLIMLGLLVACTNETAPSADTVFLNANIYTVNEEQAWAEALAIRDGRIVFVGDTEDALSLAGAETKQIDLDGKLLHRHACPPPDRWRLYAGAVAGYFRGHRSRQDG